MRFTVWCPVDGAVEVSADDVTTVIVRSGSDVEVALCCPVCGTPIAVRAQIPPGLAGLLDGGWGDPQSNHAEAWDAQPPSCWRAPDDAATAPSSALAVARDDAYVEYFRRELAEADTVESMLALIDVGASY